MRKLSIPTFCLALAIIPIMAGCGQSKSDRENAARLDSIRRADSIAQMQAIADRIKQEILDSLYPEDEMYIEEAPMQSSNVKPLTQYLLIDPDNFQFRSAANMKKILSGMGFQVNTYTPPRDREMEPFVILKAHRTSANGTTTIKYESGEDPTIFINFANNYEVDKFVESMQLSNYDRSGDIYSHPKFLKQNRIMVKVKGTRAILIDPWEGAPSWFYDY